MAELRSLCVYLGANKGAAPVYADAARDLGASLARNGVRLVYGGGAVGLLRQWARGDDKLSGRAEQRFLGTGTGYLARVSEWIRDNF